jgi:hypothetical protein
VKGFARYDSRREPVVARVLVHDPGHYVGIRVDVGRWNVDGGPDHFFALLDESSGYPLDLESAHLTRVAVDASLGAAEGYVDDGGLPGHQVRQGRGVIFVHRGVVTQTSFTGSTCVAVLDPEAGVMHQLPVVGFIDDVHFDDPIRGEKDLPHFGGQVQDVRGTVEVAVAGL